MNKVRGRCRLGGGASELATDATAAGLGFVALDTSCGALTASLGHATSGGRRSEAPALLGRVVFVVGNVPPQQVLAREGLVANLAGEAAAKCVRLDVPDKVLGARVGATTVVAGIKLVADTVFGGLRRRWLRLLLVWWKSRDVGRRGGSGQGRGGRGRGLGMMRRGRNRRGSGARADDGKSSRQGRATSDGVCGVDARGWPWGLWRIEDVGESGASHGEGVERRR